MFRSSFSGKESQNGTKEFLEKMFFDREKRPID
jgi:hypothetical protein